jgi:hypothetical protein
MEPIKSSQALKSIEDRQLENLRMGGGNPALAFGKLTSAPAHWMFHRVPHSRGFLYPTETKRSGVRWKPTRYLFQTLTKAKNPSANAKPQDGAIRSHLCARQHAVPREATRKAWKADLLKNRSKSLDAPSWLWRSTVNLLVRHERAYLDHCRKCALNNP